MNFFIRQYAVFFLYPVFAFFISILLTWLSIRLMPAAAPTEYSLQRFRKPKIPLGGVAIFLSFNIAIFVFFIFSMGNGQYHSLPQFFFKMFLPGLWLLCIGAYEDSFSLSPKFKLIGQGVLGIICWHLGIRVDSIFGHVLSGWESCALTSIWFIGFINAFNLIDEMDGMAAGLGVIASVCMSVWFILSNNLPDALFMLVLGCACLGFLRYNFYPARIVMGNGGSMFIGFVFAWLGIDSFDSKTATFSAVLIPVLAAGVPLIDVCLVVWRRVFRKMFGCFIGDDSIGANDDITGKNGHDPFPVRSGWSPRRSALYLYALGCFFAFTAIVLMLFKDRAPAIAFIIVLLVFITAIRRLAIVEMWDSAKIFITGLRRPHGKLIISILHPFLDLCLIAGAYMVAQLLLNLRFDLLDLACFVAPVVLTLHLFLIYRIYWLRASINDYSRMAEALLVGNVIALLISYQFMMRDISEDFFLKNIFIYLLCMLFIFGERFLVRYAEHCLIKNMYLRRFGDKNIANIIIYGGGLNCRLLLDYLSGNIEQYPRRVLGIMDDDPLLRDLYIHGYPVVCSVDELDNFLKTVKCDQIVITATAIKDEKQRAVLDIARNHKIAVTKMKFSEEINAAD